MSSATLSPTAASALSALNIGDVIERVHEFDWEIRDFALAVTPGSIRSLILKLGGMTIHRIGSDAGSDQKTNLYKTARVRRISTG